MSDSLLLNTIHSGDLAQLEALISAGSIDVNARLSARRAPPPLVLAASLGHAAIVSALLRAGAQIDGVDIHSRTACHVAADQGHAEIVALLLAHSPAPDLTLEDWQQAAPLDTAIICNRERIVIMLIEAGAPLTNRDRMLCRAAVMSVAVLQALVARGVFVRQLRDVFGGTPLHKAAVVEFNPTLLRMLVEVCGVDLDARDSLDDTCCHAAALANMDTQLRWFIDAGADFDLANEDGITPLLKACASGSTDCVLLLIVVGANVQAKSVNGKNALHLLGAGYEMPLQHAAPEFYALLAAGVDPDALDQDGISARRMLTEGGLTIDSSRIETERRTIARLRLDCVRQRAAEICIALQARGLDALQTCEILLHACGPVARLIPFHQWWKIATTVKHFHQR